MVKHNAVRYGGCLVVCLGMLLLAGHAWSQVGSPAPFTVNSSSRTLTVVYDITRTSTYAVTPEAPLEFSLEGPAKVTLKMFVNRLPNDPDNLNRQASFTFSMNGETANTMPVNGPKKLGQIYAETGDFFPSSATESELDVEGGLHKFVVTVGADTPQGGALAITATRTAPAAPPPPVVAAVPAARPQPPATKPAPPKAEPEKVEPPKEEPAPVAAPVAATTEEQKDEDIFLVIEPRLGMNLAISPQQGTSAAAMLAMGQSLHYVLPWLEQSMRVGVGLDYWSYELTTRQVGGTVTYEYNDDLSSLIVLVEYEHHFHSLLKPLLPESLRFIHPMAGLGLGVASDSLLRTIASSDSRYDGKYVESDVVSFAMGLWAGCRFDVWHGGPLVKARYTYSRVDHESEVLDNGVRRTQTAISGAEHGGLQFYVGYQLEL